MDGSLLRRYTMCRLHLFPDSNVPEDLMKNVSSQIRQVRPCPKRLDHYTEEERRTFPKLIDLPHDYVPK